MAKETNVTRKQLNLLLEKGLVIPWASPKRRELHNIMEKELYNATRKMNDTVRIEKFSTMLRELGRLRSPQQINDTENDIIVARETYADLSKKAEKTNEDIEEMEKALRTIEDGLAKRNALDNLVFAKYKHPQGLALLVAQCDEMEESMSRGNLYAPGSEGFVIDLGRKITLSVGDDTPERGFSFEHGEIFAENPDAAKNWKFETKKILLDDLECEEGLSSSQRSRRRKKIEQYFETIVITVINMVELTAEEANKKTVKVGNKRATASGILPGQMQLSFEETKKTIAKEREVVEVVYENEKDNVTDCIMGTYGAKDSPLQEVVVCKKIIPTSEFIFDVELVFYNMAEVKRVWLKDEEGNLLRNEDGTFASEVKLVKTPVIDCRIFAYESAIDIEREYSFDEETLKELADVSVLGKSLVAGKSDNGVYLRSLNSVYEAEELQANKDYLLYSQTEVRDDKGNVVKVKKGDVNKIVCFADFIKYCKDNRIVV